MQRIATRGKLEIRGKGLEQTLVGYAAVFHRKGDPSTEFPIREGVVERIAPTAFDNISRDVAALYNHDKDQLIGRQSSGTLRLRTDDMGLRFEVDLPQTTAGRDVAALASRGDLTGASFGFVTRETVNGDGYRELRDVDLIEISPVVFPAYEGTSVMLRCDDPSESDLRAIQTLWRARKRMLDIYTDSTVRR